MSMQPLISIIIPVYNVKPYLRRCLASVREQTYRNLEIILVDDGSTDSSGILCEEYALADDRVKVLHQSHANVSVARNRALDICQGQYLVFVDADDYLLPDMVALLYAKLVQYAADIAACESLIINLRGQDISEQHRRDICIYENNKECLFALEGRKENIALWGKLYRTALFQQVRFNETVFCASDTLVWPQLYPHLHKLVAINQCGYVRVMRPGSLMSFDKFSANIFERLKVRSLLREALCNLGPEFVPLGTARYWHDNLVFLQAIYTYHQEHNYQSQVQGTVALLRRDWLKILKNPFLMLKTKVGLVLAMINPTLHYYVYYCYHLKNKA